MKILHTADWHLGKYLNNQSLLDDQRFIMKRFLEVVRKEQPDVVIIAGDIYDRSVPPSDAVTLFDNTIDKLIREYKTKVIAISGNHDSSDRIHCYSGLLEKQGFYIMGRLSLPIKPVIIEDDSGPVYFYSIPYIEPELLRHRVNEDGIRSHEDVMHYMVEEIMDTHPKQNRSVFIGHAFISGGKPSDSERILTVGGVETVPAQIFDAFSYTALGHLHRPQSFLNEKVHYSGSPLKYSFSEADHTKSVSIVHLDGLGMTTTKRIDLKPRRDLRRVKGRIIKGKFILDKDYTEVLPGISDFLEVTLTNEEPVIDAMQIVQKSYPNTLKLQWEHKKELVLSHTFSGEDIESKNPVELFGMFYEWVNDEKMDDKARKVIEDAVTLALKEEA
ncbi:MAG TPA: exonuclease SbcCD subunit D [Balneolales bacterium]|nr:exonuclease SbcCD subunit D [Balneolales bacterium]